MLFDKGNNKILNRIQKNLNFNFCDSRYRRNSTFCANIRLSYLATIKLKYFKIFFASVFALFIPLTVYQHHTYLNNNFTELILYAQTLGFMENFLVEFDFGYSKFPKLYETPKSKNIFSWDAWYSLQREIYSHYSLNLNDQSRRGLLCELLLNEPQPTPFIIDLMQNFDFAKLSEKGKNDIALESTLDLKKLEDRSNNNWFYVGLIAGLLFFCFFYGKGDGGGGTSFSEDKISKITFEQSANNSGLFQVQAPVEAPILNSNINAGAIIQHIQHMENVGQSDHANSLPGSPRIASSLLDNAPINPTVEMAGRQVQEIAANVVERENRISELQRQNSELLIQNRRIQERLDQLEIRMLREDGPPIFIEQLREQVRELREQSLMASEELLTVQRNLVASRNLWIERFLYISENVGTGLSRVRVILDSRRDFLNHNALRLNRLTLRTERRNLRGDIQWVSNIESNFYDVFIEPVAHEGFEILQAAMQNGVL